MYFSKFGEGKGKIKKLRKIVYIIKSREPRTEPWETP